MTCIKKASALFFIFFKVCLFMNPEPRQRPTLSRTPGTSLHRQLFVVLRDQITRGLYAPGALIPKEEELCTQFSVSRITVRRALADLEALGLLEKRQGSGTFVSADLPPARPLATLGFIDSLRKVSSETKVDVLSLESVEPMLDIAHQLELPAGEQVVHIVRLRKLGEMPVMVTEAWIPASIGQKITRKQLQERALFEILIEHGIKFGRVIQEMTAVAANPFHASLLDTEIGQPLVKLTRLIYDVNRRPVQHLTVHISPERSRVLMDIAIDAVDTLAAGSIFHDVGNVKEKKGAVRGKKKP